MRRQQGFTLIELMIVVAIVGILATIALPAYNDYVTRGKIQEATSQLSDLRVKMEQYYMDNRKYNAAAGVCGIGAVPVAPPQVRYFLYGCTSAGANAAGNEQTYIVTATGIAAQGMDGFVFSINEGNTKATAITAGSAAAAGGYAGNATCWVQKKSGTC